MAGLFTGQFDDAPEEDADERLQEELELAGRLPHQARLSAASRPLGFTHSGRPDASSRRMEAAAFMSMLGGTDAGEGGASRAHVLSAASPYYQRQASHYHRPYLSQQSAYSTLHSPNEANLYAHRAGYGYVANSSSPDQRYHPHYGVPSSTARDFGAFYGRSQELSQAALLDRAYGVQHRHEDEEAAAMLSAASAGGNSSALSAYLSKGQANKAATASSASAGKNAGPGRPGRGGRGGGRGGRGRGAGRGGRGGRGPQSKHLDKASKDKGSPQPQRWYAGCVPLGLPEDKFWLSELQVYLRSNFAEAFGATEADIAAPMHGRNKPIALGQVGIRCMHCRTDPPSERGQQATSYPSLISGIYNSVQQMLRLHFDCCLAMPPDVRQKIESLKVSSSARGGRKQYWIDSAKRLGLVDTPHGIHFGRDPFGPLPPLMGPSVAATEDDKHADDSMLVTSANILGASQEEEEEEEDEESVTGQEAAQLPPEELYPLVLPEDKPLISDYLYLTLEQMQPCNLMEADKVGCYKGRKVGFPGLACKHCVGQAGCGRYFPASEASLSQTTTSQTIMNHVRNCRRCPIEIRENLELMKRARMGPDGKRADKPKHGGRKVFFHRLWCRIQRLPMDEEEEEEEEEMPASSNTKKKKRSSRKKNGSSSAKKSKRQAPQSPTETSTSDMEGTDLDDEKDSRSVEGGTTGEDDTETEEEESRSSGDDDEEEEESDDEERPDIPEAIAPKSKAKSASKVPVDRSTWHEGCVRLTKPDDPHWLSEMQCYVRSDLVEVFSLKKKDGLDGYGGRKEPALGQVGIRCVFCKALPRVERPAGCVNFPDSLSSIHTKVGDLIRLHFPSCPGMPDDVKETFRSLRGFGSKADGDTQQYWIDSARDIGLSDLPGTMGGWGLTFRRDPLQPSPADDLDRENAGATTYVFGKSLLVRAADRGMCTDHVMLLLRQVKPCRFKKSDRRGGPGARGRDRVIGFPGLCCKHCTTKNNFGRYFPVSAKNLTDNTANSLQSHVGACSRCPEPIKASLAYLLHRSVLQKAELSGSWKKAFFKRVWDRLHVERAWSTNEDGDVKEGDNGSLSSAEHHDETESKTGSQVTASDSEDDGVGDDMADMIKAAAIWLSEQDAIHEPVSRTRMARARALPAKRIVAPSPRGRGRGSLPGKRRRVTL